MQFNFSGGGSIQNFDTLRITDKDQVSHPISEQNEDSRQEHLQQTISTDPYGFSNHASLDNLDEIVVIESEV